MESKSIRKDNKKGIKITLPEESQKQYEDLKKIYATEHKNLDKAIGRMVLHYIKDTLEDIKALL